MKDNFHLRTAFFVFGSVGILALGYYLGLQFQSPELSTPVPVVVVSPQSVEPLVQHSGMMLAHLEQLRRDSTILNSRPSLEDCPPGIEVSYRVIDGKPVVEMPLDELESQIHAKGLCQAVNQMKLLEHVAALESLIRIKEGD